MKGRRNIFKIALTSVLSATMCLTGALAVKSVVPTKAFAEGTVETSLIVDNVIASGGSVSYGENTDATGKTFTGLKLTGSSNATFDLGTIDLSKSYWNGVDMTYGAEQSASTLTDAHKADMQENGEGVVRDYNKFLYDTSTENLLGKTYSGTDYANFISFAYAPHVDRQANGIQELGAFVIKLTDANNPGNYLEIISNDQGDSNLASARLGAKGNSQGVYAGMRKVGSGGPRLYKALRVKQYPHGGATQIPYNLAYSQNWGATSESERNPALYSPNGSDAAGTIAGTWLIRKFAKTTYVDNASGDTNAWNGFSGSKVNVTVTFTSVNAVTSSDGNANNNGETSLIITSLGGYDLTQTQQTLTDADYFDEIKYNAKNPSAALKGEAVTLYAPVKSSVITSSAVIGSKVEIYDRDNTLESTVIFNDATETYTFKKTGAYTLKWFDKDATSQFKATVVKVCSKIVNVESDIVSGITASNGSAMYISDKKQVSGTSTFSGIHLTGSTGATFNLGTFKLDNNKLYWNGNVKDNTIGLYAGTNDRNKAANAGNDKSYGSFFSYVYDPDVAASVTGDLDIDDIYVTLREVGNESNFVRIWIRDDHTGSGGGDDNGLTITAKGTNSNVYKSERYYRAGVRFDTARKQINAYGNQTTPIDLVWDNEKATVYTNTSFGADFDGIGGAWGIRQFNQPESYYAAGAYDSNNFSQWAGFTDGATLSCTVEFANVSSSNPSSIIVTSFAGVDLTNATYPAEMTVETKDVSTIAGVKCNLLDGIYMTDGLVSVAADVAKITVSKDGAAAAEVDLVAAKTYEFTEHGAYAVTYYDNFDGVLGTSTYTVSALTANITAEGGEVRRNGVIVNTGDELSLEDVLTFVPTGSVQNNKTTIAFDVLRSLTVNGSAITAAEKQSGFTLNVADYVSGATLDIVAVFDAEVNVYMTDSRKGLAEQLVETLWASDGKYTYKGYESINYTIQSHFKELSDGSYDMLLGFGRYQMIDGVKTSIVNAPVLSKQYLSVVEPYNDYSALYKDNYLEALYINVKTDYQVRVGVDESDSGLRMVTELKQADVDLYNFYNVKGLSMTVRTNYTILNHLQEAKGKDFDIKTIKASDWMTGGWDPVPGQANTLGLYATGQDVDTTGKPLFYQYKSAKMCDMNEMVSGVTDGYIGYAVTLRNFNEANVNQDYLFQSTWTVDGSTGGATGCVGYAKTAKMSTLATEVYNAAFGAEGSEYQYAVTVDGETKYSKYNQNQIDWLRKMAGKA